MKVDIAVLLFGSPEFELQDYKPTEAGIREYAVALTTRLAEVAQVAGKLQADGWALSIKATSIEATHPDVTTAEEAVSRLARLGVSESIMDIGVWDGEIRLDHA
jgi:hypothetical protein